MALERWCRWPGYPCRDREQCPGPCTAQHLGLQTCEPNMGRGSFVGTGKSQIQTGMCTQLRVTACWHGLGSPLHLAMA